MFHITAILEGHILLAERVDNNVWQVQVNETLADRTFSRLVSDEQLGATLALAVGSDQSSYADATYPLAEQMAARFVPDLSGIDDEAELIRITNLFRLIP
jgi:hypothetical protein